MKLAGDVEVLKIVRKDFRHPRRQQRRTHLEYAMFPAWSGGALTAA